MELIGSKDNFLQHLQFEKRLSNHTLIAYETDLLQFINYLNDTYQIKSLSEINYTIVRSWIVSLMEEGITARSVNRKITTLKTFYKYLLRQEIVNENPMLKILPPKTSKRLPVYVEEINMNRLFDNVEFGADFEGVRDKLILEIFYATGMRLSELVNLKELDVDVDKGQLKVLGKRNKERIIPFGNEIKESIKNYLSIKADLLSGAAEEYLIIDKKCKKITQKFVYTLVNKYLSKVTTIDKKSPHVLRHTFATHMLNNGADLTTIKELLGHANLSATQVYTHNTVEKLKNIHKQAHPRG